MPTVRAIVHIGPMKTGSTAFAAALAEAERSGTLAPGVLYPIGQNWFGDQRSVVKHHQLNAAARREPLVARRRDREQEQLRVLEEAIAQCVRTAVDRAAARDASEATILLVAEGASHQPRPERLTTMLGRHVDRIDYVLVARAQPRAIGSIIAHGVKDIGAVRHDRLDAVDHLGGPARARRFDYAAIVERWRHEGATLHIVPYDEDAPGTTSLLDAILDTVELPRLTVSESLAAKRTHPSFSAEGLRELARIKRRYRRLGWIPGAEERYRRRFTEAWARHHQLARDGLVRPWRLPRRDVEHVAAAYAESNRRFRALLGADADRPAWRGWFAIAAGTLEPPVRPTPTPEETV